MNYPEGSIYFGESTSQKKAQSKKNRRKKYLLTAIAFVFFVSSAVMLFLGFSEYNDSFGRVYRMTFLNESTDAYDKMYQTAFDTAKAPDNPKSIRFNGDEKAYIEALSVNSVEVVVEKTDNEGNLNEWIDVEGGGTFIINLQRAECITDSNRGYILVRVPSPELTDVHIIRAIKTYFSDTKSRSGYSEGANLTTKQESDAIIQLREGMLNNKFYNDKAKELGTELINEFVRECNPNIQELKIEVEFY